MTFTQLRYCTHYGTISARAGVRLTDGSFKEKDTLNLFLYRDLLWKYSYNYDLCLS